MRVSFLIFIITKLFSIYFPKVSSSVDRSRSLHFDVTECFQIFKLYECLMVVACGSKRVAYRIQLRGQYILCINVKFVLLDSTGEQWN
jgi:hypothetical protein